VRVFKKMNKGCFCSLPGCFAAHERQIALLTELTELAKQMMRKLDEEEAASAELRDELPELTVEQQQWRQAEELNRLQAGRQEEQERFATTDAAELARLQTVHQKENAALRIEASREADLFENTSNHSSNGRNDPGPRCAPCRKPNECPEN
jgi:hypothetical protein